MPRYYFSLSDGRPFKDVDWLDLPDLEAARDEAMGLARDLIRLKPNRRDWSSWSVRVTDEDNHSVLEVRFSEPL